jgi:nitroreductase|tara:strand:- start:728 stop:1240 length:513 start_codon:yes stop_codon:yes gene_type:complete
MNVYECLRSRRTVRHFSQGEVSERTLNKILNAARWAPSSRNQQPWHLVVVKNRRTLDQIGNIAKTGSFIGDAPLAIAIVMEGADQPGMDAGRALQQMELMAWSEGLGTCFVTLRAEERNSIKKILQIPDQMELITVLPFGVRSGEYKGRGTPRKPLSEMVHTESFGKFME